MKRFRFRLARLARVRAIQEEETRAAWQAAEQVAAAADAATQRAADEREAARELLARDLAAGTIGPEAVLLAHQQLDRMDVEVHRLVERARTARFQADQARAPWEERRRDVRALERLEERARHEHVSEAEAEEAAALDEVALLRASRKSSSTGDLR